MAESNLLYKESLTVRTASGNIPYSIVPDSTTGLLAVYLVSAVSGTTPDLHLAISFLDANNNSIWIADKDGINAAGSGTIATGPGMGYNLPIPTRVQARIEWLISGTTPSFTFQLSFYACSSN